MSSWMNYQGLQVPDAPPPDTAGVKLRSDLMILGDRVPTDVNTMIRNFLQAGTNITLTFDGTNLIIAATGTGTFDGDLLGDTLRDTVNGYVSMGSPIQLNDRAIYFGSGSTMQEDGGDGILLQGAGPIVVSAGGVLNLRNGSSFFNITGDLMTLGAVGDANGTFGGDLSLTASGLAHIEGASGYLDITSWATTLRSTSGNVEVLAGQDVFLGGGSGTSIEIHSGAIRLTATNEVRMNGTGGMFPQYTTSEKLSLPTNEGLTVYDSTLHANSTYNGTEWTPSGGRRATSQSLPSDPATTTSTTGVMMGLAGSITPIISGAVMIVVSGDIDNNTAGDGAQVQIRTGTGSAPANGAALTGTTRGSLVNSLNPSVASLTVGRTPFSLNAVVTGLTLGTAVWVDVGLAAVTGGTSRIRNVSISVIEVG